MSSVEIGLIETGRCCATKFDDTYPVSLDAFMTVSEFKSTIDRVNNIWNQKQSLLVRLFTMLIPLVGIILLIIGAVRAHHHHGSRHSRTLVHVGSWVLFFGILLVLFIKLRAKRTRISNIRTLLSGENYHYANRAPACSIRMVTTHHATKLVFDLSSVALSKGPNMPVVRQDAIPMQPMQSIQPVAVPLAYPMQTFEATRYPGEQSQSYSAASAPAPQVQAQPAPYTAQYPHVNNRSSYSYVRMPQ